MSSTPCGCGRAEDCTEYQTAGCHYREWQDNSDELYEDWRDERAIAAREEDGDE